MTPLFITEMLERAKEIIDEVAKQTDEIILFHSLTGKDSIVLLDLLYPKFKRVICVFMYIVKDLEHANQYYMYAKSKYPNIEFIQVPHYALFNFIKFGYMGCKANPKQKQFRLSEIQEKIKERTGVEWVCCGFKQSDSLNRRLMLRSYTDGKMAINWKTKKFYPLSTYKNRDIIEYIERNNLKRPETYGDNAKSSGQDIASAEYLLYLQRHYPNDLKKIYMQFPACRTIIPQYEAKRNKDNQAKPNQP